ncbi:5'-3' exonuclease [Pseudalkalibacillus berkeleyi]|uniref:5'-3' exonuclease n=1 Tax=Pseudalkalibacillus berkeleyi TaxID=1069813 RepID=A0ABS9H0W3_9BACL|nr:5'-3' exonuclease H3TH domain-containing protein [Pseudalkalibacillus berkeleyi]MCF6137290.1 flap endonuclease [Pseudalkalibacillus berkeleyi]
MSNRFIIIDGFNLLSRCYFATSYGREDHELTKNSDGLYTNALRVKVQKLLNLIEMYDPTHLMIAWDVKREETLRRQRFPDYKDTRNELPEPLIQQYNTITELFDVVGVTQMAISPYEADDIMGTLSRRWSEEMDGECLIYSNDRDLLQLLTDKVSQIIAKKKEENAYTLKHFTDEYGITPDKWIDVKALLGDKSDNIPGVHGVGEKAALPMIQQYGSVEAIYELEELDPAFKRYVKKIAAGREMAFLSKELVTIDTQIPILNETPWDGFSLRLDRDKLKEEVDRLELRVRM